jgi:hypothetical protein
MHSLGGLAFAGTAQFMLSVLGDLQAILSVTQSAHDGSGSVTSNGL